jgi:hypothetical protein
MGIVMADRYDGRLMMAKPFGMSVVGEIFGDYSRRFRL